MGRFPTSRYSDRGRSKAPNSRKKPHEISRKEYNFYPLGMDKNKAAYDVIKDKIENNIQQTFGKGSGEIVKSMRDRQKI